MDNTEGSFYRMSFSQIPVHNWARCCVGAKKYKENYRYLLKEEILD